MNTDIHSIESWSKIDPKPVLYKLGSNYYCCLNGVHLTRNMTLAILANLYCNLNIHNVELDFLFKESIQHNIVDENNYTDSYTYFYRMRGLTVGTVDSKFGIDLMGNTNYEYFKENIWDVYKHLMDNDNALIVA
jgi:hypothetical protein